MMIRGSLYLLTSIGTIIGAVIMLNKKILGLYVYTVSQVIYLITIFFALSYYVREIGDFLGEEFAILVAMFFVVPSVAILAMYWTQLAKQHLK
jgi:ABC-type transport system involved in multi-copper enzyme maturation permease subunit